MRKNTICIDFSKALRDTMEKPSREDIENFLEKQLGLKVNDIEDFCHHGLIRNVYVKMRKEEKVDEVAAILRGGVFWDRIEKDVFGWRVDAKYVTVQVANISAETDQIEIAEEFSQFGEVIDCRKNRSAKFNCTDGTAAVRIRLGAGVKLPSFIRRNQSSQRDAEIWRLYWKGQGPVGCYRCGQLGHGGRSCSTRMESYAAAVGGAVGGGVGSGGVVKERGVLEEQRKKRIEEEEARRVAELEKKGEKIREAAKRREKLKEEVEKLNQEKDKEFPVAVVDEVEIEEVLVEEEETSEKAGTSKRKASVGLSAAMEMSPKKKFGQTEEKEVSKEVFEEKKVNWADNVEEELEEQEERRRRDELIEEDGLGEKEEEGGEKEKEGEISGESEEGKEDSSLPCGQMRGKVLSGKEESSMESQSNSSLDVEGNLSAVGVVSADLVVSDGDEMSSSSGVSFVESSLPVVLDKVREKFRVNEARVEDVSLDVLSGNSVVNMEIPEEICSDVEVVMESSAEPSVEKSLDLNVSKGGKKKMYGRRSSGKPSVEGVEDVLVDDVFSGASVVDKSLMEVLEESGKKDKSFTDVLEENGKNLRKEKAVSGDDARFGKKYARKKKFGKSGEKN